MDIVAGFAAVPHCFTLQCCYGHFVCAPDQDPQSLDPIPRGCAGSVRYRIAYIGFCLENSQRGRALCESLARVPVIDTGYIQFGSADWFWGRWVNSYALQVEPVAHQLKDEAVPGAPPRRFILRGSETSSSESLGGCWLRSCVWRANNSMQPLESLLPWRFGGTRRNPLDLRSPEDGMKGTGTRIILRNGLSHQDPARALTPTDKAPP